jgi:hypothetical protein
VKGTPQGPRQEAAPPDSTHPGNIKNKIKRKGQKTKASECPPPR